MANSKTSITMFGTVTARKKGPLWTPHSPGISRSQYFCTGMHERRDVRYCRDVSLDVMENVRDLPYHASGPERDDECDNTGLKSDRLAENSDVKSENSEFHQHEDCGIGELGGEDCNEEVSRRLHGEDLNVSSESNFDN